MSLPCTYGLLVEEGLDVLLGPVCEWLVKGADCYDWEQAAGSLVLRSGFSGIRISTLELSTRCEGLAGNSTASEGQNY